MVNEVLSSVVETRLPLLVKIGLILLCVELVKGNRELCLKYTVF